MQIIVKENVIENVLKLFIFSNFLWTVKVNTGVINANEYIYITFYI